MGESLLYVQPLYLQATNSDLPELKRVIVSSGGRVAWAERLDEALDNLLGTRPIAAPEPTEEGEIEIREEAPQQQEPLQLPEGTPAELSRRAERHFEAARDAAQRGDWARYGEEIGQLEEIIRQLVTVTGGMPAETP
jgi:uncharacterized membrane protein (UPF0182 family)